MQPICCTLRLCFSLQFHSFPSSFPFRLLFSHSCCGRVSLLTHRDPTHAHVGPIVSPPQNVLTKHCCAQCRSVPSGLGRSCVRVAWYHPPCMCCARCARPDTRRLRHNYSCTGPRTNTRARAKMHTLRMNFECGHHNCICAIDPVPARAQATLPAGTRAQTNVCCCATCVPLLGEPPLVLERRIAHVHTRHRHGVKARIDMVIAQEKIIADSRARTGGRQDSAACDTQAHHWATC